ncbi:MAG: hypothetical protein ACYDA3_13750 [Gaiellaceae bacterium]
MGSVQPDSLGTRVPVTAALEKDVAKHLLDANVHSGEEPELRDPPPAGGLYR